MAFKKAGEGQRIVEFPDWIAELYERIKDQKLGDIVIPATHDSGSFSGLYLPAIIGNARTQDRNLGQQLEDGIRMFDLRVLTTRDVGWWTLEKKTFYLTHGMSSAPDLKLEPQLDMIAKFAADHPKEIIILQISHPVQPKTGLNISDGEDMSAERKADLVNLLISKLGRRIFRYGDYYSPTPSESSYPSLREVKVRGPVEAGLNIIILSDLETGPGDHTRWFWPGSESRTSWNYTTFISNASIEVEVLLKHSEVTQSTGDIPANPFTEEAVCAEISHWKPCKSEGFREVVTKLLLRRHEEAQRHDPPETPPYKGIKDIDLSRRLFDIGFSFSSLDIRSAMDTVNPYALDLLKEWEKGEEGTGPNGRRANTRKQINVVSFDYYNHFDVVKTVVAMNENRFPWQNLWQNLGSLACGFSSELAVGQNEDGRLEVFAVGKDGEVWTNCQMLDGKWAGWVKLKPSTIGFEGAKDSKRIAVALGKDGRMQLFACGKDGTIWNICQTSPNGGWGEWQTRGRPTGDFIASDLAVAQTKDGRLDVHVTNRSDPFLWHTWQTGTNDVWHGWQDSTRPRALGNTRRLAVNQDSQGRQEVVVVCDSYLHRVLEGEPNTNSFNGFKELGNPGPDRPLLDIIDVGRNQDGRLEAFALCSGQGPEQNSKRYICHTWQSGPNKDWGNDWHDSGAPPRSSLGAVAVGSHKDGRLAIFALDDDSRLWQISQTRPNDSWGNWVPMTGSAPAQFGPHLQVGRAKDGALWLFTYDSNQVLWSLRA